MFNWIKRRCYLAEVCALLSVAVVSVKICTKRIEMFMFRGCVQAARVKCWHCTFLQATDMLHLYILCLPSQRELFEVSLIPVSTNKNTSQRPNRVFQAKFWAFPNPSQVVFEPKPDKTLSTETSFNISKVWWKRTVFDLKWVLSFSLIPSFVSVIQ